jgi:excisionase family DNA binding protein
MDSRSSIFSTAPLFAGEQRYVRVKRALSLVGIGKTTLYRWIAAGHVRAIKVGQRITMIDLASIEELFRKCPQRLPPQHVERNTISAMMLGLPDEPNIAAPPDPDPLPAFTLDAADLDELGTPPGAAPSNSGR